MNLPLPVRRNRLAAARRVLSFGMSDALRTNKQPTVPSSFPPSFFFKPLTLFLGLALISSACRPEPRAAAPPSAEQSMAPPLHWPTTSPPALRGENPDLWVSLAAHLPLQRNGSAQPLVLQAAAGSFRFSAGAGPSLEASRLELGWQQRSLAVPLEIARQVLGPFPSHESAEQQAQLWRQRGAAAVVAHPDDWEVWAPLGSPAAPGEVRLVRQRLDRRWQPFIDSGDEQTPLQGPVLIDAPDGLLWRGASYRGQFRLQSDAYGSWTLVQEVPIEDYLQGVVPHEIGAGSPTEALKAQAILARTWAVANQGRFRVDGYHLCSDTQCQVYSDPSLAGPRLQQALISTSGLVLTWDGQAVHGVYSASNGGVAAGLEEVWQAAAQPYLKPFIDGDAAAQAALPLPLADPSEVWTLLRRPGLYGEAHPRYRWSRRYSAEQLSAIADAAEQPIGAVQEVQVAGRGPSGRVLNLALIGTTGQWTLARDQIRRRLRALPSTLFVIEPQAPGLWRFEGGGFGHGAGLSQAGAIDLAGRGWSSEQILSRYFPGAQLRPLKTLSPEGSP